LPLSTLARVVISAHIARLRAAIGHELILLPSVSVLPIDEAGRLLLVRHAAHPDGWAVLGGAVDLGESPAQAAVREAREEIGADIRLIRLLDVLGGPDYQVTYPNGDMAAYVTAVYAAEIVDGIPGVADDDELCDIAWFAPAELPALQLTRLSRALLHAAGHLGTP
jgi:ADP-ribose pyrophosphatase YjhB (NUDIX family)